MRRSGGISKILVMKKLKSKVYVSFRVSLYNQKSTYLNRNNYKHFLNFCLFCIPACNGTMGIYNLHSLTSPVHFVCMVQGTRNEKQDH